MASKVLVLLTVLKAVGACNLSKEEFDYAKSEIDKLKLEASNYQQQEQDFNPEDYELLEDEEEFDFVIVGGGSSGLALAAKLAEVERFKVLVLEAGRRYCYACNIPYLKRYMTVSEMNWNFMVEPSRFCSLAFKNNVSSIISGRILGGGTMFNDMIYGKGHPQEYNSWGALNPGWNWEEVKQDYEEFEDYHLQREFCQEGCGNVWIENPRYEAWNGEVYIEAAVAAGLRRTDLSCDKFNGIGYMRSLTRKGKRETTIRAYLSEKRPNLKIRTRSYVTKIDIQDLRAVGVQYVHKNKLIRVKAKKEVILAAGAFKNPHLLQLSGIGPKEVLEKAQIPLVLESPVGRRVKSHVGIWGIHFEFLNPPLIPPRNETQEIIDYICRGRGLLSAVKSGTTVYGLVNNNNLTDQNLPPEAMLIIFPHLFNSGDDLDIKPYIKEEIYQVIQKYIHKKGFNLAGVLTKTYSEGTIEARTNDPFHYPKLDLNSLSDERDVEAVVKTTKLIFEIASKSPLKDFHGGIRAIYEDLPGCKGLEGDEYLVCYTRHWTLPLRETASSCRMGPVEDKDAVVDYQFRVHGVKGLRVVGSGTNPVGIAGKHTTISILTGEKAAKFIKAAYLN